MKCDKKDLIYAVTDRTWLGNMTLYEQVEEALKGGATLILISIIPDVLKYIKTHYTSDITLSDVAAHFYLNPSYLSRIFKEQTGFL